MNKFFFFPFVALLATGTQQLNAMLKFNNRIYGDNVIITQSSDLNRANIDTEVTSSHGSLHQKPTIFINTPTTYPANTTRQCLNLIGTNTITVTGTNVLIEADDTSAFTGKIKCLAGAACIVRTKTPKEQRKFTLEEEDSLSLKVEELK